MPLIKLAKTSDRDEIVIHNFSITVLIVKTKLAKCLLNLIKIQEKFVTETISEIAAELKTVDSVLFITGAGISVDSGLPTYRGQAGLYTNANPEEGIPIEVILSGRTFRTSPELTWKYLLEIEEACRDARYNRGHEIIAAFEKLIPRVWVLTQNIDGFHKDAGSKNLIEMHGSFRHISCTQCAYEADVASYENFDNPPLCPDCQNIIRPSVVLFGEQLPGDALEIYSRELSRGFDLVFSIGTSSRFPYITDPVYHHYRAAKTTIEINPESTDVSRYTHYQIRQSAADALTAIWKEFNNNE